jgi:hypothetical protein
MNDKQTPFFASPGRWWMRPQALAVIFMLVGLVLPAMAQEVDQKGPPGSPMPAAEQMTPMEGQQPQMADMASAMKNMADTCRMMMQREMEHRPYMMIAGGVAGGIGVAALVLLIVLEIQGIRYLGVRIKSERQKISPGAS